MNPRIQKVMGEIEKTKTKISEFQARLRELERQKIELENAEIVAIFRKEKMTEDEFARFVSALGAKAAPASGKEVSHEE
ncbi:DUF4315 family protein [Geosporobacter ferrireducens]|jgi:DNA-binding transcriptional regulator YiaG|uniref:DUF4315 family protein n=1 Tax=Geosporobacter ferrireducens TaxID=1424294 RepID=A0A1D8GCZ2_9FIRM|nr:DUF4315 family protein [Geosporobacter ferrireducens]AOT68773.1 hypothetical protein Gferi_03790 [Geosporobacter ferrireducens]